MRTHLEFRSAAFPPYPGEDEEVNPGRYGKRLAQFLHGALLKSGFQEADLSAEDWGWRISLKNDAFPLWIGCGNYDEYSDGFLCFIEPSRPFVRKWFKRLPTADTVGPLASALESALSARQDVRDLRWWTEAETQS
jgi:hypothetical protein